MDDGWMRMDTCQEESVTASLDLVYKEPLKNKNKFQESTVGRGHPSARGEQGFDPLLWHLG
jgi:hypothetical protein